jgi:hypothetical protein
MEIVSAGPNRAAQVKSLVEQCQGLSLRPRIGFFFAHEDLNLLGHKTADGSRAPSRYNPGFLYGSPVEANRQILLSIAFYHL